jgi:hypothetical protein
MHHFFINWYSIFVVRLSIYHNILSCFSFDWIWQNEIAVLYITWVNIFYRCITVSNSTWIASIKITVGTVPSLYHWAHPMFPHMTETIGLWNELVSVIRHITSITWIRMSFFHFTLMNHSSYSIRHDVPSM